MRIMLCLVILLLCASNTLAQLDCSPVTFFTQSVGGGSTSTLGSITCPAGKTAAATSLWVQSSDQSLITVVVRDQTPRVTATNVRQTCNNIVSYSAYDSMSVTVTCNKPSGQTCNIQHKIGFLCSPVPFVNYMNCEPSLNLCPLTSSSAQSWNSLHNPRGGVNLMNQFCCADGTDPVVDNTENTCRCGPVVLRSAGYDNSTYWFASRSVRILSPQITGAGSGLSTYLYDVAISPSLVGTGLAIDAWGINAISALVPQPKTSYRVTFTNRYHTGVAPLVFPINIAIGNQTFLWVRNGTGLCSTGCGGGTQSVSYQCEDQTGEIVANAKCAIISQPATSEACNTQDCIFLWVRVETGVCSAGCGGGVRPVTYRCQQQGGELVEDFRCLSTTRPSSSETCNVQTCSTNAASSISFTTSMIVILALGAAVMSV